MKKLKSQRLPNKSKSQKGLPVVSLNSGETTRITSELFMPDLNTAARRVVTRGGGVFRGQIGKCRVKFLRCGGSVLITLRRRASQPVGMAIISWSLVSETFVGGELASGHSKPVPPTGDKSVNFTSLQVRRLPKAGHSSGPVFSGAERRKCFSRKQRYGA